MAIPTTPAAPLAVSGNDVVARATRLKRAPDDMAMIRAAAELTREFSMANPRIYWADFLRTATPT